MIVMWRATLREASLTWRAISSIAPELARPRLTIRTSAMIGRRVTEPHERLLGRHHAGDQSHHQGGERHQIVAPAAPDQEREQRAEQAEQDDLLGRHAGPRSLPRRLVP
jgi:hypothetical protein